MFVCQLPSPRRLDPQPFTKFTAALLERRPKCNGRLRQEPLLPFDVWPPAEEAFGALLTFETEQCAQH